jgi:poly(beta-D-mannuronate) lyase
MPASVSLLLFLCTSLYAFVVCAAEDPAEEIAHLASVARPGDLIALADGVWRDQAIKFRANGTAERPITLRATTPGKVVLSGKSSIEIDGEYIVVSGLLFQDGTDDGDTIALKGQHCQLTECAVLGGHYKFLVHLFGRENRVDHCYLADKTSEGPTMQVEAPGEPNGHRIDHNHFGPRPPLGRNGGESMRVGYSHQSMNNSRTLVEQNLFERCNGENEIISNKSCENVYRGNTFRECSGFFTLRHGNRCRVEGNFFLGQRTRGTGGIRVIGEGHTVINNYLDGLEDGALWITAGIPDSPLVGYFQARDCIIAFNTIVDSRGPLMELCAGLGRSGRTLLPENITVANNVFAAREGDLFKGNEGAGWRWLGNVATTGEHAGVRVLDPRLVHATDGMWRPVAEGPLWGAAEGEFATVTTDIDGQSRPAKRDVGCDQISKQPVLQRPLTVADLGPSWRKSDAR